MTTKPPTDKIRKPITQAPPKGSLVVRDWIVVESMTLTDGGNGFVPNGIMLCVSPSNNVTPFVVWTWSRAPEMDNFTAAHGDYIEDLDLASYRYYQRAGLNHTELADLLKATKRHL